MSGSSPFGHLSDLFSDLADAMLSGEDLVIQPLRARNLLKEAYDATEAEDETWADLKAELLMATLYEKAALRIGDRRFKDEVARVTVEYDSRYAASQFDAELERLLDSESDGGEESSESD